MSNIFGKLNLMGFRFRSGGTAVMETTVYWNPRAGTAGATLQGLINNLAVDASATNPYVIELPAGVWDGTDLGAVNDSTVDTNYTITSETLYLAPFVSLHGSDETILQASVGTSTLVLCLRGTDLGAAAEFLSIENIKIGNTLGCIIDICDSYANTGTNDASVALGNIIPNSGTEPVRLYATGIAGGVHNLGVVDCILNTNVSLTYADTTFGSTHIADTTTWASANSAVRFVGCYLGRTAAFPASEAGNSILRTLGATGSFYIDSQLIGQEAPSGVANYARFAQGTQYYCRSTQDLFIKTADIGTNTWATAGGAIVPTYIVPWDPALETLQALMDRLWTAGPPTAADQITILIPPGTFDETAGWALVAAGQNLQMYPWINLIGQGGVNSVTRFIDTATPGATVEFVTNGAATGSTSITGIEILRDINGAVGAGDDLTLNLMDCYVTGATNFDSTGGGAVTVNLHDCVMDPTAGDHTYNTVTLNADDTTFDSIVGASVTAVLNRCSILDGGAWSDTGTADYTFRSCYIDVDSVSGDTLLATSANAVCATGSTIVLQDTKITSLQSPPDTTGTWATFDSDVLPAGTEWYCRETDRTFVKMSAAAVAASVWESSDNVYHWDPATTTLQALINHLNTALTPTAAAPVTIIVPAGTYDAELNAAANLEPRPHIHLRGAGFYDGSGGRDGVGLTTFSTGAALTVDMDANAAADTDVCVIEGINITRAVVLDLSGGASAYNVTFKDCNLNSATTAFTGSAAKDVRVAFHNCFLDGLTLTDCLAVDFNLCTINDIVTNSANKATNIHNFEDCSFLNDAVWNDTTGAQQTRYTFRSTRFGRMTATGVSVIAAPIATGNLLYVSLSNSKVKSQNDPITDCGSAANASIFDLGSQWVKAGNIFNIPPATATAPFREAVYTKVATAGVPLWSTAGAAPDIISFDQTVATPGYVLPVVDQFVGPVGVAMPADRQYHIPLSIAGPNNNDFVSITNGGVLSTLTTAAAGDAAGVDSGGTLWVSSDHYPYVSFSVIFAPQGGAATYWSDGAAHTNCVYIGVIDAASANPLEVLTRFMLFRCEDPNAAAATGNIYQVTCNGGGVTPLDTGVNYRIASHATRPIMTFAIDMSDITNIRFFIDGTDVSQGAAGVRTLAAGTDLQPVVMVMIPVGTVGAGLKAERVRTKRIVVSQATS